MPWYSRLERIFAPTTPIANLMLVAIIGVSLWVLLQKRASLKALWVAYVISP